MYVAGRDYTYTYIYIIQYNSTYLKGRRTQREREKSGKKKRISILCLISVLFSLCNDRRKHNAINYYYFLSKRDICINRCQHKLIKTSRYRCYSNQVSQHICYSISAAGCVYSYVSMDIAKDNKTFFSELNIFQNGKVVKRSITKMQEEKKTARGWRFKR